MTHHQDSQLTLLARLPVDGLGHVGGSNDLFAAQPGYAPVTAGRLHLTMALLGAIDAPQAYLIQLVGWILSTIPPFAFRVAFDELIVSTRSALLTARDPAHGALACQAHIAGMLRDYGVVLPKQAMPVPRATLGYGARKRTSGDGGRAPLARPGIDAGNWLVDELVLVRSASKQTGPVVLGRWQLPARPEERRLFA